MFAGRNHGIGRSILTGLLVALALTSSSAQAQGDGVATVAVKRGISSALRAAVPRMITSGDRLNRNDRIVTGPGGHLKIAFDDGYTVWAGSRTTFVITAVGTDGTLLKLTCGTLRIDTAPAAARPGFEVRTPHASLLLQTADCVVQVTDSGSIAFARSGQIEISTAVPGYAVTLESGFGVDLTSGETPMPPQRWDRGRIDRLLELTALPTH